MNKKTSFWGIFISVRFAYHLMDVSLMNLLHLISFLVLSLDLRESTAIPEIESFDFLGEMS